MDHKDHSEYWTGDVAIQVDDIDVWFLRISLHLNSMEIYKHDLSGPL
jgi:hypothetical protein